MLSTNSCRIPTSSSSKSLSSSNHHCLLFFFFFLENPPSSSSSSSSSKRKPSGWRFSALESQRLHLGTQMILNWETIRGFWRWSEGRGGFWSMKAGEGRGGERRRHLPSIFGDEGAPLATFLCYYPFPSVNIPSHPTFLCYYPFLSINIPSHTLFCK